MGPQFTFQHILGKTFICIVSLRNEVIIFETISEANVVQEQTVDSLALLE